MAELRRRALSGLAELVPADVLMWDRVELASGVVRHETIPADAEPPGAFAAIVGDSAGHPLLSAHAARRRPALRMSEAVEPRHLSHSELYGDLLHPSGVEYCITIGVRAERREMVVAGLGRRERQFSERDRDVLDLVRPGLEAALQDAGGRERLVRALAADPPPGTAIVLLDGYGEIEHSSPDAERWLGRAFRCGRARRLAAWGRRRLASSAAASAARQRPGRATSHRPVAPRRSARAAGRGGGRELPARRTRSPWSDPARDRGALCRARDQGRGGHRMGAMPQPARGPRSARTPRSQARRTHRRRRSQPGAPREQLDSRPVRRSLAAGSGSVLGIRVGSQ